MTVERGEHRARECSDGGDRSEQAGMTRDAAERPGVLVVDLADEQPPSPGIHLGRRRAIAPASRRVESQWLGREESRKPSELRVEPASGIPGARRSGEAVAPRLRVLENESQEHESEVAVDRPRPRRVLERQLDRSPAG